MRLLIRAFFDQFDEIFMDSDNLIVITFPAFLPLGIGLSQCGKEFRAHKPAADQVGERWQIGNIFKSFSLASRLFRRTIIFRALYLVPEK